MSIAMSDEECISLQDALTNVAVLDDLPLSDEQPCIEALSLTLECRANFDTNFEDGDAFVTGCSKYIEEATRHGEFNEMLREGYQHACTLYTWRCCSRAVPMAKSNDQPDRVEINTEVARVLEPEVRKLYLFMYFTEKAVSRLCQEVERICRLERAKGNKEFFVSESYLLILGRFLNMLAILDELKNMKASIKNDFSTYRRAAQFLQSAPQAEFVQDHMVLNQLSLFLATQNNIKEMIRDKLQQVDHYEELLADIVSICSNFFESQVYLAPEERHMHVKVIAFCLYLMDGGSGRNHHGASSETESSTSASNVAKLDAKKRISIARLDKIFKSLEVVPMFGDMQIQPFAFVKRSPHYDASRWPLAGVEGEHCQVNIVGKLPTIREHHDEYVTHLARIRNELAVYDREGPRSDAENREIYNLTLSGIQLLCGWTSDVMETVSWKLLNPTDHHANPQCPESAEEYERATKFNYSAAEKAALVEVVAMVKGVQALIGRMEPEFSLAIRKYIYMELQEFVAVTLRDPLHKAAKHKKDYLAGVMSSIMDTCADASAAAAADLLGGGKYTSRSSDLGSAKYGGDKKKSAKAKAKMGKKSLLHAADTSTGASSISVTDLSSGGGGGSWAAANKRGIAPSFTQLYLARTMLESIATERNSGGKRVLRKDIAEKHAEKMAHFLRVSHHWPALLQLSTTLERSADLSQLWFREFYLEMTMGRRIQFPIDMSIPWILIDHCLAATTVTNSGGGGAVEADPALTECILYQLDLYNDAANFALKRFKKQFLYDEVEAEVNLCFDQFIFKLSEAVFTHYKQLAANMLLDKGFKGECARMGIRIHTPPAMRYETLLQQRHFQLLGRSIDLNRLVSQRVNASILRSLELAIRRFEAEGLHAIVAFDSLMEVNRLCHSLLAEHLHGLADFDDLFAEVNHQVSTPNGRLTLHIFSELVGDLLPNYCFNTTTRRYTRCRVPFKRPPPRERAPVTTNQGLEFGSKSLNVAFNNLSAMFHGFVGVPHLKVVVKWLGYQGIATTLEELLALATNLINDQLKAHVRCLLQLAPKSCKLPRYDYGSDGVLQYYIHHTRDFATYTPLRREWCQVLRELGNLITFMAQLELALAQEEMLDLLCAAPFTGMLPKPPARTLEEQESRIQKLETKYARIKIAPIVQQMGGESLARIAKESELLTRERLCCGLNIFEMMLNKLRDCLASDSIWRGGDAPPSNGVMWVEECVEFHRLWSGFQFLLCMQQAQLAATLAASEIGGGGGGKKQNQQQKEEAKRAAQQQQQDPNLMGVEELYGDGVLWAGCTLIRLLNQHRRFEVLDYSYHLLRVHRAEPRSTTATANPHSGGKGKGADSAVNKDPTNVVVDSAVIVERVRRIQAQNNQIFGQLSTSLQQAQAEEREEDARICHYAPPVYQPSLQHQINNGLL